ncbi:hypothetical protein [Umezawaea sp. Da 62-37]|uniref:hypothetical protein n=1 Tax=Umezawaea sp. Da 62-37 TaxID=3075927 RepID=UPI0028F729A6|nr:hypothetical protein [Umezawaea sp. Da 62-37]WNV83461.1 hypothetical protein RM788_35520 [Umezawaea sp. Da 62-37]
MDELAGPLIAFFLILVVVGFIGSGLAWVATHYPVPFWLGVAALLFAPVAYLYHRFKKKAELVQLVEKKKTQAQVVQASVNQSIREVSRKRQEVSAEYGKVEELKSAVRGEVNFKILTTKHFESMQLADGYYDSMRSFAVSRDALSEQVSEFGKHLKELGAARNGKPPRGKAASHAETVKVVVADLRQGVGELRTGITSLRADVESYNDLTRRLKIHIRDTCGERGRRWYRELEERTHARKNT